MTPLHVGQQPHTMQHTEPCMSHQRPLQSESLQRCHAATDFQPSGLAAMHRLNRQRPHKEDTLLTKWLAAGRSKAAAPSSAADHCAKPSHSASSVGRSVVTAGLPADPCQEVSSSGNNSISCSANPSACTYANGAGAAHASVDDAGSGRPADSCQVDAVPAEPAEHPQPASASCTASVSSSASEQQCFPDSKSGRSAAAQPAIERQAAVLDCTQSVNSVCGIKVIWVAANARRRGIAPQMLVTVR